MGVTAFRLVLLLLWLLGDAAGLAESQARVRLGIDLLQEQAFRPLRGKRIGLIAHPASVDRQGRSTIGILHRAVGLEVGALFGPEHGVEGRFGAGEEFPDGVHVPTGLPMRSLYGPGGVRAPSLESLQGLDAMVYDLQDIGFRAYTYISTLGLAMEACGRANLEFVVLDRPNPVGGLRVEGPVLEPRFRSFIGRWPIPMLYGMTPGELALMIAGEKWIPHPPKLRVIRLEGWRRSMTWKDTGLRWTPTSPGLPTAERCLYLPATSLVADLGGVSVGFGTPMPYECVAAPWIHADLLAHWLEYRGLPGIHFEPVRFTPTRGAYAGQEVQGVHLKFTDPARAPLAALNVYLWDGIRRLHGRNLCQEALRRGHSFAMFDKICGTDRLRRDLVKGRSSSEIIATWAAGEESFRRRRAPYLLYPR